VGDARRRADAREGSRWTEHAEMLPPARARACDPSDAAVDATTRAASLR
jgi:hypothetical protein